MVAISELIEKELESKSYGDLNFAGKREETNFGIPLTSATCNRTFYRGNHYIGSYKFTKLLYPITVIFRGSAKSGCCHQY